MGKERFTPADRAKMHAALDRINLAFGAEPATGAMRDDVDAWMDSENRKANPPRRSGLLRATKH